MSSFDVAFGNKLNKQLGKPEINFHKGLEQYYLHYEPKKTKRIREMKLQKKYVAIGISVFLSEISKFSV